jgi:anhydro-N-acetylmuramic acid kinase
MYGLQGIIVLEFYFTAYSNDICKHKIMNTNIQNLYQIANKSEKIILGLMSGTSLDGLDLALCKVSESGISIKIQLIQFITVAYSNDFKKDIQSIFCKEEISLEKLCLMNAHIGFVHSQIINKTLTNWNIKNSDVDLIASHGQTIYHAPKSKHQQQKFGNATLQIGDADFIALNTNIITISDFRQKHIAAGGEGAPLAVYGDYFLLSSKDENRILLNIGGIANFTFLPTSLNIDEVICTDVGPGNTLMDAYVQHYFPNKFYDENAMIALQGNVNDSLLKALCNHEFFKQTFPKTTGQEIFNLKFIIDALEASNTIDTSIYEIMATLNYFTAFTIVEAIKKNTHDKEFSIYVNGGGASNPLLMQNIQQLLPNNKIKSTNVLGINPDAKEAILFAVLANECICGNADFYRQTNKKFPAVTMGKVSFPK